MREEISPRTIYLPPLEEDEELFAKKLGVWNLDQMCSNENYNNVYQTTIVASLDARSIFYISFYVTF